MVEPVSEDDDAVPIIDTSSPTRASAFLDRGRQALTSAVEVVKETELFEMASSAATTAVEGAQDVVASLIAGSNVPDSGEQKKGWVARRLEARAAKKAAETSRPTGRDINANKAAAEQVVIRTMAKKASKSWFLNWDPVTKTMRLWWTENPFWRVVAMAIVLMGFVVGLGFGYLANSTAIYAVVLNPDYPTINIVTNMCDVYINSGVDWGYQDGLGYDSYVRASVDPACSQTGVFCLSIQADLNFYYPMLNPKTSQPFFDKATNTLTVNRVFETSTGGGDERRGARCKIIARWGGNVDIKLTEGDGNKLHVFNDRFRGLNYRNHTFRVSSVSETSFVAVWLRDATFRSIDIAVTKAAIYLKNVTVESSVSVAMTSGVFDMSTSQNVRFDSPATACLSGGGVYRRSATRYDLFNTTGAGVVDPGTALWQLPVVLSAFRPYSVDAAVTVWATDGLQGDKYAFQTISVESPDPVAMVLSNGTNATSAVLPTNNTASLNASTVATTVLNADGRFLQANFSQESVDRLQKLAESTATLARILIYTHMSGAYPRAQFSADSWVATKLSPTFMSIFTFGILAPELSVVHLNARRGFCPAMLRRDTDCPTVRRIESSFATPVFGCTAPAADEFYWGNKLLPVFGVINRQLPVLATSQLRTLVGASPFDLSCWTNPALASAKKTEVCLNDQGGYIPVFVSNGFTGAIKYLNVSLLAGPNPLVMVLVILSLVVGAAVALGIIAVVAVFAKTRFVLFRMDALIQDERARELLQLCLTSTCTTYGNSDFEYNKFDLSMTKKGLTSIGEVVQSPFIKRLIDVYLTKGTLLLKMAGDFVRRNDQVRTAEILDAEGEVLQNCALLSHKLLLLERSSTALFLVELSAQSVPGPSPHPSIEESVYWAKTHVFLKEVQVVFISFCILLLPPAALYYPAIAVPEGTVFYCDQFEGVESIALRWGLLSLAWMSHFLVALGFLFAGLSRTGYELPSWKWRSKNKYKFGDEVPEPVDFGKGFNPRTYLWHRVTMFFLNLATFAILLTGVVSLGFLVTTAQWTLLGLFLNPTKAAPFAAGIAGIVTHVVSLKQNLFSTYDNIASYTRTGIANFTNLNNQAKLMAAKAGMKTPEERAALKMVLTARGDEDSAASARLEASKKIVGKAMASHADQADFGEEAGAMAPIDQQEVKVDENLADLRKTVYPDEILEDVIRNLLNRKGINFRRIVLTIVSSTLVIIAVLVFLFIGLLATTDSKDGVSSIIGTILSLGTVGGLSLGQKPDGGVEKIKQIADGLISDYRRTLQKNNLTFSAEDNVLEVISTAAKTFAKQDSERIKEEARQAAAKKDA